MDLTTNFDRIKQAEAQQKESEHVENYATPGTVRKIGFELPSGEKFFRSYAQMTGGDYRPDDGTITLRFFTEDIVLHGINLDSLYEHIRGEMVNIIKCAEKRYLTAEEQHQAIVTEISVKPRM